MAYVPEHLRLKVAERADFPCEYCHSAEFVTGGPFHIEHIKPEAIGGTTVAENLAYACARCNLHKGQRVRAFDPVSDRLVPLSNPRKQRWVRHFHWSRDGTRLVFTLPRQMRSPTAGMQKNRG